MATGSGALKPFLCFRSAPMIALFILDVYYVDVGHRGIQPGLI